MKWQHNVKAGEILENNPDVIGTTFKEISASTSTRNIFYRSFFIAICSSWSDSIQRQGKDPSLASRYSQAGFEDSLQSDQPVGMRL